MGVFGAAEDRRCGTVGYTRAIENTQRTRDPGSRADRLLLHVGLELGAWVPRSVLMILPRNVSHYVLHHVARDRVLLRVRRLKIGEHRRSRDRLLGTVIGAVRVGQTGIARVLELFDPGSHYQVVGTRGDRVACIAE